jgi:methylenetetrahydrofolate--tRNA-(uracil-5-)-methyltransferase
LQNAEFIRYGWIHRNTYLNAPDILLETYQTKTRPNLFFAGQLSGVEGYVDSAASGLLAGLNAALLAMDLPLRVPPPTTALGALAFYISHAESKHFQPMNITFGLLRSPEIQAMKDKKRKKELLVEQALNAIREFANSCKKGDVGMKVIRG